MEHVERFAKTLTLSTLFFPGGAAEKNVSSGRRMQDASPSAEPSRRSYILLGERVLIPATLKNSTTGYKNVNYDRGNNKFKAQVRIGGKSVSLGYFDTAEEAARPPTLGQSTAAPTPQSCCGLAPLPLPLAPRRYGRRRQREGLTLTASSSNSGYKGVTFYPNSAHV